MPGREEGLQRCSIGKLNPIHFQVVLVSYNVNFQVVLVSYVKFQVVLVLVGLSPMSFSWSPLSLPSYSRARASLAIS